MSLSVMAVRNRTLYLLVSGVGGLAVWWWVYGRLAGFADRFLVLENGQLTYDGPASGFPVSRPLPANRGRASP